MNYKKLVAAFLALLMLVETCWSTNLVSVEAAEITNLIYGDVDESESVDAGDALAILKHAAKISLIAEALTIIANVDGSESIDAGDALLILKKAAKIILVFPVEENSETPSPAPVVTEVPKLDDNQYFINYYLFDNDKYLEKVGVENVNPGYYTSDDGLKLRNLKIDGYRFLGWFDGEGDNATQIKEIEKGETGIVDLYAHWEPVEYKISFDSPISTIDSQIYTVNTGATLEDPEWFGYTFIGWSDDEGNLVERIEQGTTGNITLYANWTSKRNQTVPVKNLKDPVIYEDTENGQYLFAYEIGRIENVPIFTIKDFGNRAGIDVTETETKSGELIKAEAQNIAQMVSDTTTCSSSWTLSKDWNKSTTISETRSKEVSEETIKNANWALKEDQVYNIGKGYGIGASINNEIGVSGKLHNNTNANISATVPLKVKGSEASAGIGGEFGWELGGNYTNTVETNANWNVNEGYEHSLSASKEAGISHSLSKKICEQYGYSDTLSVGGSESVASSKESSQTNSREYASSLSYSTAYREESEISYSNANAPTGYYRLVCAGTIRVFAVVGYDIATSTYFTYTHSMFEKEYKKFLDYSATTPAFDDNENGVLPFEVPYYVNEYVNSVIGETEGLSVDINTGIVSEYNGEAENVLVPKYTVRTHMGKSYVVKITGIAPEAFQNKTHVTSVKLPDSIEEIPDSAFAGCTALKGVYCPSVDTIGANAFKGCLSLNEFSVSEEIKELGANAFKDAPKIKVKAANSAVAKAATQSGAKQITLNLEEVSDPEELNNETFAITDDVETFELYGGGKTYSNLKVISDANTTNLSEVIFVDNKGVPMTISSENVSLGNVTANTSGIALILKADHTKLGLFGNSEINSSGANAIVCKNVTLYEVDANTETALKVKGDMLVCGEEVEAEEKKLLSFAKGNDIVYINKTSYEQLINDSLEWVLESDVPGNAQIVGEKWTYDLKTNITSDKSSVVGYTLYDTKSAYGDYGEWSSWSKTTATASDTRQVETKTVTDKAGYTRYKYWIWRSSDHKTLGTYGYKSVCYNYSEVYLNYQLSLVDSVNKLYGYYKNSCGHSWCNQWFYGGSSWVPAVTHTEYRYRDRQLVYTYYHTKTETKESATEVSASDTISNVQKWVQYIIK